MKGVILHGGFGTKLRPLTFTGPKQLIPVANKPISQYVLEDLRECGIREIAIVLGNIYPEKTKEHYGDGSKHGVRIRYVQQDEPKGIAHAVGLCEDFVGDSPFVVYLGDNLIKGGIVGYVREFSDSKSDAMILLCQVKNPERFGVAKMDSRGRLVQLIEKPMKPPSDLVLTGIYFFTPKIFGAIKRLKPSQRGELEITEAIQLMLEGGKVVHYEIVKGYWKDTGTPEDIIEANRLVLDELRPEILGKIEDPSSIQNRVSLGKNSIVRKGAMIRGPVVVGEDTIIEREAYIGPYTSIGNHCRIVGGHIENSIVMDYCRMETDQRITDSLIASHSEITSVRRASQGKRFILGERTYLEL